MKKTKVFLLYLFFHLTSGQLVGQNYLFSSFQFEDGLSSEVITCISQDEIGLIWIGSDDGLIMYDGYNFHKYPRATKSQYLKGLLRTSTGKLLVVEDLGVREIIHFNDSIHFRTVVEGAKNPTEGKVWYPKSVYEDEKQGLWFAEPASVSYLKDGEFKRYDFGEENYTNNFHRSFQFVEHDGILFVFANNGNLFMFDESKDSFQQLPTNTQIEEINHISRLGDRIFLAANSGLFEVILKPESVSNIINIQNLKNLSFIHPIAEDQLLLLTFKNELLNIKLKDQSIDFKVLKSDINVGHHIFKDREDNYWISTKNGILHMKKNSLEKIDLHEDYVFVEDVQPGINSAYIYFCSKNKLQRIAKAASNATPQLIFEKENAYFLALTTTKDKIWLTDQSMIHVMKESRIVRTLDFGASGRYIFDITTDRFDNVWFSQEGFSTLTRISNDNYDVTHFNDTNGLIKEVSAIEPSDSGIFVANGSDNAYLCFLPFGDSNYVNLSKPAAFEKENELSINAVGISDSLIWLASNEGLLYQDQDSLYKVNLGEKFTYYHARSLKVEPNSSIVWFTNPFGVIRYDWINKEYFLFNEINGLPSSSMNSRGLELDEDNNLWIGTANGLAKFDQKRFQAKKTPRPVVLELTLNGKIIRPIDKNVILIDSDDNLNIAFSSLSFPNKYMGYRYRINGKDSRLSKVQKKNEIKLPHLDPGKHTVEIQANKNGNYRWSDPLNINIEVAKTFYESALFYSFLIISICIVALFTWNVTHKISKKREQNLHRIVDERTRKLKEANKELSSRNRELDQFVYSVSHDLSAPLKSLAGLINLVKRDLREDEKSQIYSMMSDSVHRLERFIKDVINYSRNSRLKSNWESVNLYKVLSEIIDNIKHIDSYDDIDFIFNFNENASIITDLTRFKIVMNNLLSNAVKFRNQDPGVASYIKVNFHAFKKEYHISVEDNGLGINKEYQTKIFDMFYRATDNVDGSGLGLYILKETIRKMKGSVWVESEEGKGSTFFLVFPAPSNIETTETPLPLEQV